MNIYINLFNILYINHFNIGEKTIPKHHEKMLNEEFYGVITENANDLISVLSLDFIHEYINEDTYYRKLGYKNHSLPHKPSYDRYIFYILLIIYEIFTAYFMP